jgi:uncharacterized protein (DUF2147 family)
MSNSRDYYRMRYGHAGFDPTDIEPQSIFDARAMDFGVPYEYTAAFKNSQGMLTNGFELPEATWDESQKFDAYGNAIPIMANKAVITHDPKSMTLPEIEQSIYNQAFSEAEILKAEEAAKAGEAWKTELQRWMKASGDLQKENKKIAELEQGMLTAQLKAEEEAKLKAALEVEVAAIKKAEIKTEAERKAKEVEAKEAEAKRIAEAEAKRKAEAEEDAKISKDAAKDLDEDSGRSKPVKMENLRGEKPGFVMADGTNWWSVDEKDDYWQTKEGHKEAMKLYGQKPSWVKEPSLEYNPKTGKYDSIQKEVFVDLKPTKRISL